MKATIGLRRCVSCRQLAPKSNFWRVVRSHPTGTILIDQGAGRSAYLCRTVSCLKLAQKQRRLSRALRAKVTADVYQMLWERLND